MFFDYIVSICRDNHRLEQRVEYQAEIIPHLIMIMQQYFQAECLDLINCRQKVSKLILLMLVISASIFPEPSLAYV